MEAQLLWDYKHVYNSEILGVQLEAHPVRLGLRVAPLVAAVVQDVEDHLEYHDVCDTTTPRRRHSSPDRRNQETNREGRATGGPQ